MVDDGTVDVLYLNAYKRMGLAESDLNPSTSSLYGFTRDHVVTKGMVKLTVIVGEHPRPSTIVVDFLIVDYTSAIDGIIRRPLLKALKAITSIYHLTVKFPIVEGTSEVQGARQLVRLERMLQQVPPNSRERW